jgi:DNA polymerase-3 subunit delta'
MSLGASLVYGSSVKKRKEKIENILRELDPNLLKEDHPDLMIIKKKRGKKNISIKRSREVINFLSLKPYNSPYKAVVVQSAENLTSQAQNALLKTLEEPPEYAIIILSAKKERALLPTVISRCKKYKVEEDDIYLDLTGKTSIEEIIASNVGQKLRMAQEIAERDREEVIELMEQWIREQRHEMLEDENYHKASNIKTLVNFLEDVEETNINVRLALETLFLKLQ